MSLTDLWQSMRDRLAAQEKSVPASSLLPRMRETQRLQALKPLPKEREDESSVRDVTPFAQASLPPAAIPPPPWQDIFPGHYKALAADFAKRGESMTAWEIMDGRDAGVSETGHTVAFTLHKIDTSVTILVELTLCKGQLSKIRVR